jgi:hypothetical protein
LVYSYTAAIGQGFYKWFTAMFSKGNPVSRNTKTEKAKSFYDEMKIMDKYTFSDG